MALGRQTHSETASIRAFMDSHKTERPSPAFDNLLITRDLTEGSARFYTEENLGRRVYTEPDIHCWVALMELACDTLHQIPFFINTKPCELICGDIEISKNRRKT